jgi:hypothetical protein
VSRTFRRTWELEKKKEEEEEEQRIVKQIRGREGEEEKHRKQTNKPDSIAEVLHVALCEVADEGHSRDGQGQDLAGSALDLLPAAAVAGDDGRERRGGRRGRRGFGFDGFRVSLRWRRR